MALLRQWFLILSVLGLGGGQLLAASARENRDYAAAADAFQAGMYERAETAFARFVEKYPDSPRVAEAVLLQGQAELKQRKLAATIALLTDTNHLAKAGNLADVYFYWTGEAQFTNGNYSAAAETWGALAQKFPESRLRLQSVVEAASAFAKLEEWRRTVGLLEETNGVFQRARQTQPKNELVRRGELMLAKAKFELKDYGGAAAILEPLLDAKTFPPDLRRQCALLLYQVRLAAGDTAAALAVTTNLLQNAQAESNADWQAEGLALQAGVLEKLGRVDEAIAAYQENLTNAPAERQREAVLKIAQLAMAQGRFPAATNALETFLAQFPDSPSADVAYLTLAELRLKNSVAPSAATNQLPEVQAQLDEFISTFTNSPLLGKAYLDRGWCKWLAEKIPESFADFKTAAQKIAALQQPPSEDLLVAWFKMGDAQFAQGDFAGALENYRAVRDSRKLFPEAGASLGNLALYQSLRASLELKDMAGATNALAQILQILPAGDLAQGGALLVAERQTDLTRPADARALLENFETTFANSSLRPQVELAVARTYEREQNWPAAVTNYENWLAAYPTNGLRPQAVYSLGWADFQAGYETNAFGQFTNFVALYPTNGLAPLAQWWVADHFYRAGDYPNAERNYKSVFESWPASDLANQAKMMAGRAAVGRLDYNGAILYYFSKLEADTNCPLDLRVQATFAHGKALMLADSTDTNNPLANFALAANEFSQITQIYPTNELGALAWGELGHCYLQLTNFAAATNAYARVINFPSAGVAARSQAQIGYGIALEKAAALASSTNQAALLNLALDNYSDVLFKDNLRDGEQPDGFWRKEAGLQAASLAETMGNVDVATNVYMQLEVLFPQSKDSLERKIAALQAQPPPEKD